MERRCVSGRTPWALGAVLLFLGVAASEGAAQETGTVRGQVTQQASGQPLAGAQVHILGTGIGALSDAEGRFALRDVPVGEVTVRAQTLGFATVNRTITVSAGEEVVIDFVLTRSAIGLDEIVITGTAGGTQRRAVGNVVDRISAADLMELTPSTSVTQLIGQRSAGVSQVGGIGGVGTGARIRIRGVQSMGLSNDPIVYVDGVRMESDPTSGPTQRGGSRISRLNDINPEDIESVEIIKGPAAATLYGTEASNGVIQIVTKRGASGATNIDVVARTGTNWLWDPAGRHGLTWARDPATGELHSYNVIEYEEEFGLGPIFSYGFLQSYQANLSGGTDDLRYFVSGAWSDETGVRPQNWDKRFTLRGNLDVTPRENVGLAVSMGYTQSETRLISGGFDDDPMSNIYWSSPAPHRLEFNRGYFRAPPEEWSKIERVSDLDRFIGSVELRHTPWGWFQHRLVTGLDTNEELNSVLVPRQPEGSAHFWGSAALGSKSLNRVKRRNVTFDYGASATTDLSDRISSVTSVGAQYYQREMHVVGSTGSELPAPGITTVTAAANRTGTESFEANVTVGVFIQQQFGWEDRAFFTAAVRADDNSAFGAEFDAAIYPKVSATWVLHEEPFFNVDWVDQLRLRAAWGAAGKQPGTFDAPQLLAPQIGHQDRPTLVPSQFGNPQLKPERGEELEVGFDAEFFQGRVGVVYTRFQRTTKDAIVAAPLPRSLGWPGSQIVNLGEVKGWGNELAVDFRVIERGNLSWAIGTQAANFRNRIVDLGDEDAIGNHRVGYGIADIYYRTVVHAELDADNHLVEVLCDGGTGPQGVDRGGPPVPCGEAPFVRWGHSQPTWDIGVNSTVSVGPLRFYARVEALGGHHQQDSSSPANITSNVLTLLSNTREDPFVEAYKVVGREPMGTFNGGFARLRELSAHYTLPSGILDRVGASRGSVTLAGRNLAMLWTAEHGWSTPRSGRIDMRIGDGHTWDPEIRGSGDLSTASQTVFPPMASANMTVRLSF